MHQLSSLTPKELQSLEAALPLMSALEKRELFEELEEREQRLSKKVAQTSLLGFAHHVYPGFKEGPQHRIIAGVIEDVLAGRKHRVIVNMPPRFGKSETLSYLFPAYFLGKFPDQKIIMATHTASLSEDFGRRVRNLIQSDEYKDLFPRTAVADDAKAAGKWSTTLGGMYYAAGVGGALAGRGADLFVIDDAHSEQDVKNNSKSAFESAWSWFQTGPLQRLMPNGKILVLMCMTGDTPVLMADGTEKPLRDIRPLDDVATYDGRKLATTRVLNQQSSGIDSILTLVTRSGRILRANERHPFLVESEGGHKWIRVKSLKPGMLLVSRKDVSAPQDHKPEKGTGYAIPAKLEKHGTRSTLMHRITRWATTVSGKGRPAFLRGALSQLEAGHTAPRTTSMFGGSQDTACRRTHQSQDVAHGSNIATELIRKISTGFYKSKAEFARCVGNLLQSTTPARTGTTSSALTMSMIPGRFGDCSATIATSQSATLKPRLPLMQLPDTSDFTTDEIVSITPSGQEEVFDVEIERTECFIANGFVSHNTRWGTGDLTGKLLDYAMKNPDADQWELIELPAILNEGTAKEKSLWPEQWPLEALKQKKASMSPTYWNAQFMQDPTAEEGAIIKREWWQPWTKDKPPKCDYIIGSLDAAAESHNRADYTSLTVWGVFDLPDAKGVLRSNIILLESIRERLEFPDLKQMALKMYKEWEMDDFIVEKKSSGTPLFQELRNIGVPVSEYTPHRGTGNKTARLNGVSDIIKSGLVWYPEGVRWAMQVMDEVAAYPNGENDDVVDTTIMALMRFRNGGFITLPSDYSDEESAWTPPRKRVAYY